MSNVKRVKPKAYQPVRKYQRHSQDNKAFYNRKEWKELRAYKISLNPFCEECERNDIDTPAYYVDHIIAINDGGPKLDLKNLQSLCKYHDARKRGKESHYDR